jgi:hypothetical protein
MRIIDIKNLKSGDELNREYFEIVRLGNRVNNVEFAGMSRASKSVMGSTCITERPSFRRGGNDYSYQGPFALTIKDETNITILGYNEDEDRYWSNYIDIGMADPLEVDEQDLEVLVSGWVYLKFTQTDGTYNTPELLIDIILPAQTNTEYYHRLGYVYVDNNGDISEITQFQYGGIYLPGRVF